MQCCQVFGVTIIFIFSVVTVGLLVATGVSYDWFLTEVETATSSRTGLWRSCYSVNTQEKCTVRDNVLEFKTFLEDYDVLIVLHIIGASLTTLGIFLTLGGLCKKHRSKCLEISAFVLFLIATISILFMAVYAEVEILKDSNFTRGWAVYTVYGTLLASSITSVEALIYSLCCFDKYLEGVDNSNSLVLNQRPYFREDKYNKASSSSNYSTNGNNDQNQYAIPSKDY